MKHKYPRLLSVLCALMIVTSASWAERVSQEDAALVAGNFMSAGDTTSQGAQAPGRNRPIRRVTLAEVAQYYVYANANGEGWVMVAANDVVTPILAYSETGEFRTDKMPDNVKYWLGSYDKKIKYAEQNNIEATEEVKAEWRALRKGVRKAKASVTVSPLIQTTWDQDEPYYNLCPKVGNERTLTGCVATAMAQVMNYWQWPVTGTGSYSYTSKTQKLSCSANFGSTTYDWANMLNRYAGYYNEGSSTYYSTSSGTTAQQNAVATLMYHCGVAANMDYDISDNGGSGAQTIYPNAASTTTRCAAYALINNFGYKSSTLKCYYRPGGYGYSAVSDANWLNLLKTELDASRPIMYAGADNEGGHSFICDGYDSDNKFHFNWGWSGYCNGYYTVDNLVPGTGGSGAGNGSYNDDQDIIIGIVPDKPNITITWSVNGVTSTTTQTSGTLVLPATTPSDCSGSGGKKFVGWTASSSVSGSKPADLFTSGTGITVTENKSYYAVYATQTGSGGASNDYELYKGALTEGDYLLVYDGGAMNTTVTSDRLGFESVTATNNVITTTDASIIWHIAASGDYWTIYNAGENKYAAGTGAKNKAQMLADGTDDKSLWSCTSTASSETYDFANKQNTANTVNATLRKNGTYGFACYATGTGGALSLYKNVGGGASYSDYSLTCGAACALSGISLNTTSVQKTFVTGATLDYTGLVVTASYSNCSSQTVEPTGVTVSPDMSTAGSKTVTVTYTENGTTTTATYTINVVAPYTVTYKACGDVFTTQDYAPGAALVLPENPGGYDGLTFAGWTTTEHHTGVSAPADLFSTAGSKTVTADITYYAVFH